MTRLPATALAVLVLAVLVLAGCGSHAATPPPPAATAPPATPVKGRATKVLVVIEENHSYTEMQRGMPFLAGLSAKYGYATHWTALGHPSEPNYLAIAGGSTFGVTDDKPPSAHERQIGNATSVFDVALKAGKTAATYAESMPGNCHLSDTPRRGSAYAVRHNPWAYFKAGRAACRQNDQPLTAFAGNAAADGLPNVGFLIPDLGHDAHDGALGAADDWLHGTLTPALQSKDFRTGRLVIVVTADEDDKHSQNTILTSVLTPALSHEVVNAPLTHYSLTRYLCQVLGVPLLREASTAPDLRDAFGL